MPPRRPQGVGFPPFPAAACRAPAARHPQRNRKSSPWWQAVYGLLWFRNGGDIANLGRGHQVLVVLGVAGVVVADQRSAVTGQDAEAAQRLVTVVVGGAEPGQPAGASGVDIQQPIGVVGGDPGRSLIVMQHRRRPRRSGSAAQVSGR